MAIGQDSFNGYVVYGYINKNLYFIYTTKIFTLVFCSFLVFIILSSSSISNSYNIFFLNQRFQ